MLTLRGRGHFTDGDVDDAVQLALVGMVQEKQFARSDLGGDPLGSPVVR